MAYLFCFGGFMTFSIILYIAVSALIIGLGFRGFKKGIIHGAVGVLRTVVSASLALGIARLIAILIPVDKILTLLSGLTENSSGVLLVAVSCLFAASALSIMLPALFGILFSLFYMALIVPSRMLTDFINKKIEEKKASKPEKDASSPKSIAANFPVEKVCGVAIRVLDAVLIATLIMLPFAGCFYTLTNGINDILEAADEYNLELENIKPSKIRKNLASATSDVSDNIFLRFSYAAPMKSLYALIGAPKGSTVNNGNELEQTLELCAELVSLSTDLTDYGSEQIDAINYIGTYVSESYFHGVVAANLVSEVSAEIVKEASSTFTDSPFSAVIVPLVYSLKDSTPENIGPNITTFSAIAAEIIDSGVLADLDNAENMLANEDFLVVVITKVLENEHLHDTAAEIMNSSIADIVLSINSGADVSSMKIFVRAKDFDGIKASKEAKIIAKIISSAYKASSVLSGDFTLADADIADSLRLLGSALDGARESQILSDVTDSLVLSVLGSAKLTGSPETLVQIVENHLDDEGLSFENIFSSTASLMGIFESGKNSEGADAVAAIEKALKTLTSTLDPVTTEIIKEFVAASPELFGGSKSDTSEETGSQKLINLFVSKISDGEIAEDEYECEATALNYAIKLVSMRDNDGIASVKSVYGTSEGMNEMITVFVDSAITSDAIAELAYDENGNLTPDALDIASDFDSEDEKTFITESEAVYREKAAAGADMERVGNNLTAVGAVFGINLTDMILSWQN